MPRGLAAASVAMLALVVTVAVVAGPEHGRLWLILVGGLAVVVAVQSVFSEPGDLILALVLSLLPVVALSAEGSPTWLMGPLGVLLFVSGELNALSWTCRGPTGLSNVQRRRLLGVAPVALLALGGALAVSAVPPLPVFAGTLAVGLAGVLLASVGWALFGSASRR